MSMCESSATKEPSAIRPIGLISASVRSYCTKIRASAATMRLSRFSSLPVTPTFATASFASKSENGRRFEKFVRERCSGCCSATSSMSMPPMSEKMITGRLFRASHVTAA